MKVLVTTVQRFDKDNFAAYCSWLREIGVPILTVRELREKGSAEFTTQETDGGVVTTRYEVIDEA